MAHNLMTRNGSTAMFCTGDRDAAWHKLGQRTPNAVTWQEAMRLADLSWPVSKQVLFDSNGKPVSAWGIFREDDSAFLGAVGERYTPIQNKDAFEFVDVLMEATNGAHYDSAGALGNGERIWCSAKVPFDFEPVPGDKTETYLMFTTSHDGSASAVCKLTTVRVVCQNTLSQAIGSAGLSPCRGARMNSHTPGPWKTETYSSAEVRDGERIRSANNLVVVPEVWGASLAECEANYNLIAAAPELLAALVRITPLFAEAFDDLTDSDDSGEHEVVMLARSAIAKAGVK